MKGSLGLGNSIESVCRFCRLSLTDTVSRHVMFTWSNNYHVDWNSCYWVFLWASKLSTSFRGSALWCLDDDVMVFVMKLYMVGASLFLGTTFDLHRLDCARFLWFILETVRKSNSIDSVVTVRHLSHRTINQRAPKMRWWLVIILDSRPELKPGNPALVVEDECNT